MPWHMPADLKHFKSVTLGKPVVMGRKTYESIGRALPGRQNIVISRNADYQLADAEVVGSIEQALSLVGDVDEVMIIGGGFLYQQMITRADRLYLTLLDVDLQGDTFFPEYSGFEWNLSAQQKHNADDKNPYNYEFVTLDRVSQA